MKTDESFFKKYFNKIKEILDEKEVSVAETKVFFDDETGKTILYLKPKKGKWLAIDKIDSALTDFCNDKEIVYAINLSATEAFGKTLTHPKSIDFKSLENEPEETKSFATTLARDTKEFEPLIKDLKSLLNLLEAKTTTEDKKTPTPNNDLFTLLAIGILGISVTATLSKTGKLDALLEQLPIDKQHQYNRELMSLHSSFSSSPPTFSPALAPSKTPSSQLNPTLSSIPKPNPS